MRAPEFWDRDPKDPGPVALALTPFGSLYAAATARRLRRGSGYRASVPVICVGNLNAGGTGKTPVVMALCERLTARGIRVAVVSRGHGGQMTGPVAVDPAKHSALDVGDEPLLLSAFAPVFVGRDRAEAARLAEQSGAEALVLDDGFQNPALVKNLSLVVVDAVAGFGNGRVIPAGPLREPVETGLKRADFVCLIGHSDARSAFHGKQDHVLNVPCIEAELAPLQTGMDWADLRVLAFAGIGRPEKFFATLRGLGAHVVRTVSLADHQALSPALIARLQKGAHADGLQLVTTEKDAVRLPANLRREILTVPVRLAAEDWSQLDAALDRVLGKD